MPSGRGVSMRPAQLTPENTFNMCMYENKCGCFNEAGAINAGKHIESRYGDKTLEVGFNEAGAINAGKHAHGKVSYHVHPRFNEAGAINAGKPEPSTRNSRTTSAFQ